MKIIFFGSSDFAVPVLESLKSKKGVALTVTQPDREKGRSLKVMPTQVKLAADRLDIETFQPDDVNSKESIDHLKGFDADIFVVVSFGQILKRELLGLPKLYPLNVHASLLPKYRGAAPINWALANGEKQTGVTIIKMNEKMDRGEIILKRPVSIDSSDDAVTLSRKLSREGAELLLESIGLVEKDAVSLQKQDEGQASYAPKLKKEDGCINWKMGRDEIANRVRAFVPWPGCFTTWRGKALKIWRASSDTSISCSGVEPGTVVGLTRDGIVVCTGKGGLKIEELQMEGKRRMGTEEFLMGHKDMSIGSTFTYISR